ncbi:arylamine N-acetyltransferase family protein [Burkholderia sp. 22PA0106]|uniref:arylamine N-acetyltransferase family protein n=1 Tax=Burkholderia sp. 22PA0106 TaxID=3237371 RepID=UPI0039C4AE50
MKADNFSLPRYVERLGYHGPLAADSATLTALMRHQLFAVPFENLDVQARRHVSLVPEAIVEKIVERRRGGYCYEVNGLFAMALDALGIPYRFVAARPMFYPVRRPKTHMAVVATVDGADWLCDLGFGSYGIRAPMRLDRLGIEIAQDADTFRLDEAGADGYLLRALVNGEWASQYAFDLSPQEWVDFAPANHLNSTHPDAVFVQRLVVVRFDSRGRTILFGDSLKTIADGVVTQRTLGRDETADVLRQTFGLEAEPEAVAG